MRNETVAAVSEWRKWEVPAQKMGLSPDIC
jgi:hypothetical protein